MDLLNQVKDTMELVEKISNELGFPITKKDYTIQDLGCPHNAPTKLEKGYAAIYMFWFNNEWLKIGKANQKSNARFTSQHYRISKHVSSLSKSLSKDNYFLSLGFDPEKPKDWVQENTHRINILIKAEKGKAATELIETIMHYKFRPRYEGAI